MQNIRQILIDEIDRTLPDKECAVLLSGGVDSLSVSFAANELGKTITGYSFYLSGSPSYDYLTADRACDIMGWNFVGIEVPIDDLIADFHRLVELGCEKKTHYECVFPFLYVYPAIKEQYVLSGWGADGYYGLSKKAQINYKHTKEKFDEFRKDYFLPENCAGYKWHKIVVDKHNKHFITPYLCQGVSDFFFSFDWYEVNRPTEKHHIRSAFAEEFARLDKIKNHANLQLVAGIPTLFETLLSNEDINFRKRTRMMDVYKDWFEKNQQGSLEEFM